MWKTVHLDCTTCKMLCIIVLSVLSVTQQSVWRESTEKKTSLESTLSKNYSTSWVHFLDCAARPWVTSDCGIELELELFMLLKTIKTYLSTYTSKAICWSSWIERWKFTIQPQHIWKTNKNKRKMFLIVFLLHYVIRTIQNYLYNVLFCFFLCVLYQQSLSKIISINHCHNSSIIAELLFSNTHCQTTHDSDDQERTHVRCITS